MTSAAAPVVRSGAADFIGCTKSVIRIGPSFRVLIGYW
ncbi:hypothetical protein I549_4911 [Mycobacterium avium subsp. avium 2285 (R)]|uniref:Uncharacterized protein n=1 Tax=Mycobacterium avium (strain 104) TaxID=243243 RepID=A0A0H2ZZ47_MYCA1|nr:hypothetical protein MAV_1649 [Mycobacterium avium 104]ETZ56876.1 hypothetical protein L840_3588 [Mycobacterium sp. MAC_011194_8550]ETZ72092.1 hypothetical protein L841_1238 [Mycobacterium sp. MAC_080597_8934]EUA39168.1 hypothetical protein I549_4911 [Mycobacterium avium subsp. avium 2285 (R)]